MTTHSLLTLSLDTLATVTGAQGQNAGNPISAEGAYDMLSSVNNDGAPGFSRGITDDNRHFVRAQGRSGHGMECRRTKGANPVFECSTFGPQ
ncbi:MAG TPA: hypothetical protein VIV11_39455 [Kofleriaceae bacterium]